MNVLLIGGSGSLMDGLILKLRKEGHRVFLLTGDKYKRNKYAKVFERYDFSYDSENLREILESVNPDVTIFMGAFDSNFRWKEEEREAVRYTSSLMNILVAYASIGQGRFILLSSDEVYSGNYEEAITEEVPTKAGNVRGTTIIQAEDICENFRKNRNLDMLILRLDHLFSIPKKLQDIQNICAQMCLESLRDGSITAGLNHEFSMIYEKDAIEFIYQAVWRKQHRENVYHLSSGQKVTEVELAGMIQKILGNGSNVVTVSDTNGRCILSGQKFKTEYGMHSFFDLEEAVQKIVTYMQKHKEVFVNGVEEKLPWWKRLYYRWKWLIMAIIPFAENLICFIPFFMMNNRTVGSEYFANLDPYLLYVLLFAIVYGQQQATFSAICAVAGYLFRQMYNRTGFEVVLDYNTYVWIAQLFILGLVVGYMRDQIRTMRKESEELEEHLTRQIADIRDINESNVRVKNVMEQQLITHKDSIGKIYSITSQLDQQVPDEVMFDAVQMMKELMDTDDIAIYNVVNHDYARMFSASSEKARSLGNSIRLLHVVCEACQLQIVDTCTVIQVNTNCQRICCGTAECKCSSFAGPGFLYGCIIYLDFINSVIEVEGKCDGTVNIRPVCLCKTFAAICTPSVPDTIISYIECAFGSTGCSIDTFCKSLINRNNWFCVCCICHIKHSFV